MSSCSLLIAIDASQANIASSIPGAASGDKAYWIQMGKEGGGGPHTNGDCYIFQTSHHKASIKASFVCNILPAETCFMGSSDCCDLLGTGQKSPCPGLAHGLL